MAPGGAIGCALLIGVPDTPNFAFLQPMAEGRQSPCTSADILLA
jgi:hypothetical protein